MAFAHRYNKGGEVGNEKIETLECDGLPSLCHSVTYLGILL
jgi:hypothetical protein